MQLLPFALLALWATLTAGAAGPLRFRSESSSASAPALIGQFSFGAVAFTSLDADESSKDGSSYNLLLSAFGIFVSDVAVVRNVGSLVNNISTIKPETLTTKMKWPNGVAAVPSGALGSGQQPYIAIPDGFLVPGYGDGSVTLLPLAGGDAKVISGSSGDWFYHKVIWADMNKDGTLDALTAQANQPLLSSAVGNLVWFSNPSDHNIETPWTGYTIAAGPDALFTWAELNVAGQNQAREAIITAEYFNPRFRVFWTEDDKQDWSKDDQIKYRDIDQISKSAGSPFDVVVADLNLDGKQEIIATFNSASNGTVYIYEIPSDFRNGNFTSHLIASGYKSEILGISTGGPGVIKLIETKGEKPSFLVSGDDSGLLSLFEPTSKDWEYTRTDILSTKSSTVGGISVADVDGDGHLEIFAPSYNEGIVYVYRL